MVPELVKFLVIVEGSACNGVVIADSDESDGEPVTGFFATRFVLAGDRAQAGLFALEVIRHELSSSGIVCALSVREVRRDDAAYDAYAPGGGFTWF